MAINRAEVVNASKGRWRVFPKDAVAGLKDLRNCPLYTSPSPPDPTSYRMPASAWKKKKPTPLPTLKLSATTIIINSTPSMIP